jgi:lysophospholipase L1-like esterase
MATAVQTSLGKADTAVQVGGDIGGTASSPQITSTHLSAALPLSQGGTAATDATGARTSLGLGAVATMSTAQIAADSAISGTYAQMNTPGTFAVMGDSITALGDGGTNNESVCGSGWHVIMAALTGGRIRRYGYKATAGYTLVQIESTLLPQILALNPYPEACVIAGGTNNVSDPDPQYAALLRIISSLRSKGIRPILWKIPPRADNPTAAAAVPIWNARIHALANRYGYRYVDAYTPSVDPLTGTWISGHTADYVHPTYKQLGIIAAYNVARNTFLNGFGDATPYLIKSAFQGINLINSDRGLFGSDGNSDGLSDGWTIGAVGATYSRSQDGSGVWWQRITKAAAGSIQGSIFRNVTTGFSVGDTISLAARVNCTDAGAGSWTFLAIPRASDGNALAASGIAPANSIRPAINDGLIYARYVVPANTVSFSVEFSVASVAPGADFYAELAQLTFLNETNLHV